MSPNTSTLIPFASRTAATRSALSRSPVKTTSQPWTPKRLTPPQRGGDCCGLEAAGADGGMPGSRDHGSVVGAQLQGGNRQARPPGNNCGCSPSQQGIGGDPATHNDLCARRLRQRLVQLHEQRLYDRLLEGGGQVGPLCRTRRVAEVTQPVQKGGLQAAEAVFETWEDGPRQRLSGRVAGARQPVEGGPTRVAEPKHSSGFVERLAGGIVSRSSDDLEAAVLWHPDEVRVGATDHQPQERRLQVGPREHGGVDVAP